jgi:1-acyl-sn-glycerol-3-phosphate acyltransferase
MNIETLIFAGVLSVTALLLCIFLHIRRRFRFWKGEAQKLLEGGYLPAPSTFWARITFSLVCRLLVFMAVGPVKVVGRHNERYNGRLLIGPNHTFNLDFAVTRVAVGCHYTQVAKHDELKGKRALLAAWVGTIAAKVEGGVAARGKGNAVVEAAAHYLASTRLARLLIYPQGKLVEDNVLRCDDFRTGAARSLNQAAEQLDNDQPLAYLPVALHYKRDRADATLFHRFVELMALVVPPLRKFRLWVDTTRAEDGSKIVRKRRHYGASVVVGKPVPIGELPDDPRECANFMQGRIQELLVRAEAI